MHDVPASYLRAAREAGRRGAFSPAWSKEDAVADAVLHLLRVRPDPADRMACWNAAREGVRRGMLAARTIRLPLYVLTSPDRDDAPAATWWPGDADLPEQPDDADPESLAMAAYDAAAIRDAIATLPAKQRAVIRLRYLIDYAAPVDVRLYQGILPLRAVSRLLGMSLGSTLRRERAALRTLAARLDYLR